MTKPLRRPPPAARIREVIEIETAEGQGTGEEPVRKVFYYLDPLSGEVLARFDEMDDKDLQR